MRCRLPVGSNLKIIADSESAKFLRENAQVEKRIIESDAASVIVGVQFALHLPVRLLCSRGLLSARFRPESCPLGDRR